jgi:peptidoglycan/LPS O-acetylase OafA/YrhL
MAERQTHLDGLRGLAALVVVVLHGIAAFDYGLYTGAERDSRVSWDVQLSGAPFLLPLAGSLSVCIFFALSGYVLGQSFTNTRLGSIGLFVKRYTRLAIPILAVCMLAYVFGALGWPKNAQLSAITRSTWLASQMRQVPSFGQAFQEGAYRALTHVKPYWISYDSALWTMNIELYGSILLIGAFGLTARVPSARAREVCRLWLFAVLAIVGASSYLGLFAIGALINLTQIERQVSSTAAALLLGVGIFLGTIPVSVAPWRVVRPFGEWSLPAPSFVPFPETPVIFCHAVGAIMILLAANSLLPFRRMLLTSTAQFLGHISFPLYLIHMPILLTVVCFDALTLNSRGVPYLWTATLSIGLFVAVSVAGATGFYFAFERPSISLSGRIGRFTDSLVRGFMSASFYRAKSEQPS